MINYNNSTVWSTSLITVKIDKNFQAKIETTLNHSVIRGTLYKTHCTLKDYLDVWWIDCEQSLFFSSVSRAWESALFLFFSATRARERRASSVERRSCGTRETRAAARKEKESLSFRACPVSRLQSRACAFSRVLFDVRRTKKIERLLVVYLMDNVF